MTEIQDRIADVEATLKDLKVSVDAFCKLAKVNRATWQRWKRSDDGGTTPNWGTWRRVETALAEVQERPEFREAS